MNDRFPYLDNQDVGAISIDYDYSQWGKNAVIRVCNVPWNSDYRDVVQFDSDELRDAYIDSKTLDSFQLPTALQFVPGQELKLPIPYERMRGCNYICLDYPNPKVDYSQVGRTRFYFFVESVRYLAPSTTGAMISLDVWTTYINSVHIRYLRLERGHAPMSRCDAELYLQNPLQNSRGMLAQDVNFGMREFQRSVRFAPDSGDSRIVVFTLPMNPAQLANLVSATDATPQTVSYSDIEARYGYQYAISGNVWAHGGRDYSGVAAAVFPGASPDSYMLTGLINYAIDIDDAQSFLTWAMVYLPQFMRELTACYILDSDMVNVGDSIQVGNYTLHTVNGRERVITDFAFETSDFGFDSRYSHIAKLYTYPYSRIELFDTAGSKIVIRVEDTTPNASLKRKTVLAAPALQMLCYADGIGNGAASYNLESVSGGVSAFTAPAGSWSDYMVRHDIPTFALYRSGFYDFTFENYQDQKAAEYNSTRMYQDTVRPANTNVQNAFDSNNTAKANADRSADLDVTNTANDTNTANTNASLSATTQRANAAAANTASTNDVTYSFTMKNSSRLADANMSQAMISADAAAAALTNVNNTVGSVVTSLATGNLIGAGTALIGGAISSENNAVALSNEVAHLMATVTNSALKLGYSTACDSSMTANHNDANTTITNNNATLLTDTTANNGTNANTKAANRAATAKANSNATRNTANSNASSARADAIAIAKRKVDQSRELDAKTYRKHITDNPVSSGVVAGDLAMNAGKLSGCGIRIVTQADDEIAQTGDYFLRYGIAYNAEWEFDGFNLMPCFTYWKAADVRLNDVGGYYNQIAIDIEGILRNGVTVWRDADEIGVRSIYDNR